MIRITSVFWAFALLAGSGLPQRAAACSCTASTPTERLETSTVVFIGRIQSVRYIPEGYKGGRDKLAYTFRVRALWKGHPSKNIEVVTSAETVGTCGVRFHEDIDYLVYTTLYKKTYLTDLCDDDAPMGEAVYGRFALGLPKIVDPTLTVTPLTLDSLFTLAFSGNRATRRSAVEALGSTEVDHDAVMRWALDRLRSHDTREQLIALRVFRVMGKRGSPALDGIARAFASDDARVRRSALRTIVAVKGGKDLFTYFMAALNDESPSVRLQALDEPEWMYSGWSREQRETLCHRLADLLADPNERIRCSAVGVVPACGELSVDLLPVLDEMTGSKSTCRNAKRVADEIRKKYGAKAR